MIRISIMGGSGYVGGELLRLLLSHPACELQVVTSQRFAGEPLYRVHPNLRGKTTLRFQKHDVEEAAASDFVFTALPHGKSMNMVPDLLQRGLKILDMTADFRLKDTAAYKEYYAIEHKHPELLKKSVYGLPELHRTDIRHSELLA